MVQSEAKRHEHRHFGPHRKGTDRPRLARCRCLPARALPDGICRAVPHAGLRYSLKADHDLSPLVAYAVTPRVVRESAAASDRRHVCWSLAAFRFAAAVGPACAKFAGRGDREGVRHSGFVPAAVANAISVAVLLPVLLVVLPFVFLSFLPLSLPLSLSLPLPSSAAPPSEPLSEPLSLPLSLSFVVVPGLVLVFALAVLSGTAVGAIVRALAPALLAQSVAVAWGSVRTARLVQVAARLVVVTRNTLGASRTLGSLGTRGGGPESPAGASVPLSTGWEAEPIRVLESPDASASRMAGTARLHDGAPRCAGALAATGAGLGSTGAACRFALDTPTRVVGASSPEESTSTMGVLAPIAADSITPASGATMR
jgi:hypothetical protein